MEDFSRHVYIQDGVLLKLAPKEYNTFIDIVGSLSIVKHPDQKISLDWKPNDFLIDDEKEWAMVNSRIDPTTIRIMLEEIDQIEIKSKIVSIINKNQIIYVKLYFPHGNTDTFIRNINLYCETSSKGMKRLTITNPNIQKIPNNSLAELDIFQEDHLYPNYGWTAVGNIVRNIKERPVETAWVAGSKVFEALFGREEEDYENYPTKVYTNTLNNDKENKPEDYEVINNSFITAIQDINISRTPPLNEMQWIQAQDEFGRIQDVENMKKTIFRGGIDENIRSDVWKYLLNYYPWKTSTSEMKTLYIEKEKEYFIMKQQWKSFTRGQQYRFTDYHERKNLVEKDVNRTDRTYKFYAGDENENLAILSDILMTYVMYNFDLGYVQGMSDLLSPILYIVRNEVDAFWCFVGFMDKVQSNFDIDQAGMKHQLQQLSDLLTYVDKSLSDYLQKQDCSNMYFCFRWLLVLFKREFSQSDILRLWEVLWTELPCKNFHLLISVSILLAEKNIIIERNYEFSKILKHINDLSMHMNLESTLINAEKLYYAIEERNPDNTIRSILGMELLPEDVGISSNMKMSDCGNNVMALDESLNSISLEPNKEEVSYQKAIEQNYL